MSASMKTIDSLRIVRDRDWGADGSGRDAASCQIAEWIRYNGCDSIQIDFENTTRIDLSRLSLWFFPDLLNHFCRLEVLDLTDNLIMFVPFSISYFSTFCSAASLVDLNLSRNPIEHLPADLRRLHRLTHLNLSFTKVKLPDTFDNLPPSLLHLNLRGLSFCSLPNLHQQLPLLQALDCNWQDYLQFSGLKPDSPTCLVRGAEVCSFTGFEAMSCRQSSNIREQEKT